MKVYIVTFHQYNNYGSRMQNFALCCSIQALGAQPITLAVENDRDKIIRFIQDAFSVLPIMCNKQRRWKNNRKKKKVFSDFNRKLHFQVMTCDEMYRLEFSDAVAMAGSDQIWSPDHIAKKINEAELYFLRFAPKEKRFAYAPSFGVEHIPGALLEMYKEYICDFKQLSVREVAGQKIIKELTDLDVPVLPDPVFLLSKEEWKEIAGNSDIELPRGKYVLTYFLSKQNKALWENIKKYAQEKKLNIIRIAGNEYRKGDIVPAPDEFVKLLDGAERVFTDSFHGSVFSVIMQTPFAVFKRSDVDQLSRIDMLLKKYELTMAFVNNENTEDKFDRIFKAEDFTQTEKIIAEERQKGLSYLKQIIS